MFAPKKVVWQDCIGTIHLVRTQKFSKSRPSLPMYANVRIRRPPISDNVVSVLLCTIYKFARSGFIRKIIFTNISIFNITFLRDYPFSTYAEILKKSTVPPPMYANVRISDNVVYVDKNKWFQFITSRSNMIAYVKINVSSLVFHFVIIKMGHGE